MKLSVVIPAHNEAESIGPTLRALVDALEPEGIDYEILVVDDALDATAPATSSGASAERGPARARACATTAPHGFGFAVRAGLEAFTRRRRGDRDGRRLRRPARPRPLPPPARGRLRLRVRLALHARRAGARLPAAQAASSTGSSTPASASLFRHGYNDTTNAFKAYRREVIENLQPLLSNHFNLTVELPLKAIVRGFSYAIVPDLVDQPHGGRRRSSRCARWAAATCSSCSTSSSSTTSAAATTGARRGRWRRAQRPSHRREQCTARSAAGCTTASNDTDTPRISVLELRRRISAFVSVISLAAVASFGASSTTPAVPRRAEGWAYLLAAIVTYGLALTVRALPLASNPSPDPHPAQAHRRRPARVRRLHGAATCGRCAAARDPVIGITERLLDASCWRRCSWC